MKNKILFLVLIFFASLSLASKPKIITSCTPVASIVSMLTENIADVETIDTSYGCPHHYQIRPSDKEKIKNAQIFIFIDDNFDGFAGRLAESFHGEVIKISQLEKINFLGKNKKINWHFWLDLKNVLVLQDEISNVLLRHFPHLQNEILSNKKKAQEQISELIELKQANLKGVSNLVILTDILEHFLSDIDNNNIKRLYQKQNSSLKSVSELQSVLSQNRPLCLVIDTTENIEKYQRFNKKIIQFEENWSVDKNKKDYAKLFYNKYIQMIFHLKHCR